VISLSKLDTKHCSIALILAIQELNEQISITRGSRVGKVGEVGKRARLDDTGTVMTGRPDPDQSIVSSISAWGSHLLSSHWATLTGYNTLEVGEVLAMMAGMARPIVARSCHMIDKLRLTHSCMLRHRQLRECQGSCASSLYAFHTVLKTAGCLDKLKLYAGYIHLHLKLIRQNGSDYLLPPEILTNYQRPLQSRTNAPTRAPKSLGIINGPFHPPTWKTLPARTVIGCRPRAFLNSK